MSLLCHQHTPRFRPVTGFPFTRTVQQLSHHLRSGDYLNNGPNERSGYRLALRQTPSQYC